MKVGQALRLESRLTGGGFDVHHKGKDFENTLLRKVWKLSDEFVTFYKRANSQLHTTGPYIYIYSGEIRMEIFT